MKLKNCYFIGIGGISLSGMAKYLKKQGVFVAGSDKTKSEITQELEELDIKVNLKQKKSNIENFDTVVFTDAISESDKELVWAKKQNKTIYCRAEFLNLISKEFEKIIAVAGCHGKTTTTGMLSCALQEFKPTVHIGGVVNGTNFIVGDEKVFITEACEYKKNLLHLKPTVAVILNIGLDHMDCYKNLDDVVSTFQKFANNVKESGFIVVCGDDKNCRKIKHKNKYTFGLSENNDFYAKDIKESVNFLEFDFYAFSRKIKNVKLNLGLYHNVYNALASLAVAFLLEAKKAFQNISKFSGVERRNQLICDLGEVKVFHDYAHHPDEINKIIAEHKKFCSGKLIVAFEAHTFSRTKALAEEFKTCFAGADKLFILPIYPAREKQIKGINGFFLANLCGGDFVKNYNLCFEKIKKQMSSGDEILILGAGPIYKLAHLFKTLLWKSVDFAIKFC